MSFASVDFMVFLAVVIIGSSLLQKEASGKARELFLLLASYFFYGYWDWRFCFLLLFVTVISYFTAKNAENKILYTLGIVVPLLVLGVFKYFNFFLDSFSALIGRKLGTLSIILPVGISFYTFQALSYVIDVKRKKLDPEVSFIKLALYLSFFPQLVAGPIVRAVDFIPQLHENRKTSFKGCLVGFQLIAFGLFKKLVLSDNLSVFVDNVYFAPETFHWFTILLGVISYSFQIYLDFSGYSDIAIGCAKCLGYDFRPNFDLPYISKNVTEFWRRWHISLSTWLKEYLYIPLGGNRRGKARQYLNLFLTMLLGGLWHGANWTFVFWGALNGIALCIDKLRPKMKKPENRIAAAAADCVEILVTFCFISFTWIFFRANSFNHAWRIITRLFSFSGGLMHHSAWAYAAIIIILCCTAAAIFRAKKSNSDYVSGFYPVLDLSKTWQLAVFFIELGLIVALAYTGSQPFVYFQF